MFSISAPKGEEEDMDIFEPNITPTRRQIREMDDLDLLDIVDDEKKIEEKEVEIEGEDEDENCEKPIPFQEIGEFLLRYFRQHQEKEKKDIIFEDFETKEKITIHLLKFYNTLGDFPVKIKIRNRTYIFKQVKSMYPDYYSMEVFKLLNEYWSKFNVKARIPIYEIRPLSMSLQFEEKREFCFCGFIDYCEGIQMMNISMNELLKFILNDPVRKKEEILDGFLQSLIGSTIGNLIVGLQDRHQYNVILSPAVEILHIDLNAVFGEQIPIHEQIGLITAPSLFFPGSVQQLLKHPKIDKMKSFEVGIINAWNCLPDFSKIAKILSNEIHMKFVHQKIHSWNPAKILKHMVSRNNLFERNIRDFFQKDILVGGPTEFKLGKLQEFVHIVCGKIYKVSNKGLTELYQKDDWGAVCQAFARNDDQQEVFLISTQTGWIYCYNWKSSKYRLVTNKDYSKTKGMIYHDGYLYIVKQGLYKMNVQDGYSKVLSPLDYLSKIFQCATLNNKLYLFLKDSNVIYVFDPKVVEMRRRKVKNCKFPIGKKLVGVDEHNCIYFFDPEVFALGEESGMCEIVKLRTNQRFEGFRGGAKCGKDLLIIQKESLFLWNQETDEKKKISLGRNWDKSSLCFSCKIEKEK